MTKTEQKILSYLTPSTDTQLLRYGNDTYFCGCSKYLDSSFRFGGCIEKVRVWVENNGGRFEVKSDYFRQDDKDGKIVQIIFPGYNKKKQIMCEWICQLAKDEKKMSLK